MRVLELIHLKHLNTNILDFIYHDYAFDSLLFTDIKTNVYLSYIGFTGWMGRK